MERTLPEEEMYDALDLGFEEVEEGLLVEEGGLGGGGESIAAGEGRDEVVKEVVGDIFVQVDPQL